MYMILKRRKSPNRNKITFPLSALPAFFATRGTSELTVNAAKFAVDRRNAAIRIPCRCYCWMLNLLLLLPKPDFLGSLL
jgi:hypothetical protein